MKKIYIILLVFIVMSVFPSIMFAQNTEIFRQEGIASWYGREFEGRPTASGEIFNASQLTAAHPTLPFGTMLVVTNQHNNKSITVRINDRGPFVPGRIIDVSRAAAEQLDMIVTGTAPVRIESINRVVSSNTVTVVPQTNSQPSSAIVIVSQPVVVQSAVLVRLTPEINISPDKNYRLQVGSYTNTRNAVDAFNRLKNSGLNPAYERFTNGDNVEYYRVVLAGVRGTDVASVTEKIGNAGFREAIIREEN
ncbi:MAG: septal ring lytic transglycosylase RlpA family protein [Treponema sp.]|nr:septal ring lytic transglycosylase RlpA family protein [Treponema sp.]